MNTLFDEDLVREYSVIGIRLIHLSSNEFIDDLLKSLNNENAIKAYEILKILTQYALDEKIDAHTKSKIMNYLAKEIGEFKSKKPTNYYYTDIKIPFTITTTLENELYKAWIKIQGLSGKGVDVLTTLQQPKVQYIVYVKTRLGRLDNRMFMIASAYDLARLHFCHLDLSPLLISTIMCNSLIHNTSKSITTIGKCVVCQYLPEPTRSNAILPGHIFELRGYWQSYLHFAKYGEDIRGRIFAAR
ncbi:unnamed protein product [Rotaria sp. Silwood2]|nr:unnamed protein product [Rotaria sp. Silwood2]